MKTAEALPILQSDESRRGVGSLEVLLAGKPHPLPLAAVAMKAAVADRVASVTVTQTFRNAHKEALEAVYIFPMAGGCAVSGFELRVGTRVVRGIVKERGEARRTYREAIEQGHRAGLLEQERDDVFTVTVGNLPPGDEVTVVISYSERLPYFDTGMTELRLPMVVAPRYIPGAPESRPSVGDGTSPDTDRVPDASRITPPLLAEGFDPRTALSLEVELAAAAGEELRDLACTQHAVKTGFGAAGVKVALASDAERLDRDFVLRWRVASSGVRTTCLAFGEHAMLSVVPPRLDGFLGLARDVVFVVDRSGSMQGIKMASAARACALLLRTLGPRDRFAIMAFDDGIEWMQPEIRRTVVLKKGKGPAPGQIYGKVEIEGREVRVRRELHNQWVQADEAGIETGEKFLRGIGSRGGTELDAALADAIAAVAARRETAGRVPAIVVLTDGEVGNESEILARVQKELGDARAFTVGIDTAVNDGFLKRLAALGGGTSSFVTPGEKLDDALRGIGREIGRPLVTDLDIDGEGLDKASLAPSRVPDLFAGRAALAFFRAKPGTTVRVRGRFADGKPFDESVPVREAHVPAIAQLWARARVADLEDRFRLEPGSQADLQAEIVKLAVAHTLLTRFTAFVAVDEAEIVNAGGIGRQVVQPVEAPAGWDMLKREQEGPNAQTVACSLAPMDVTLSEPVGAGDERGPVAGPPSEPKPKPFSNKGKMSPGPARPSWLSMPASPPAAYCLPPESDCRPLALCSPPAGGAVFSGTLRASGGRAEPPDSPQDREAARRSLEAFLKAFVAAKEAAARGVTPDARALDAARADLLKAVAASALASLVPALQRFLRLDAVELVAAIASGAGATALVTMFERASKVLDEAVKEAGAALEDGGKEASKWWAFWEKSV